jgi:hypothetical protein
MSKGNKEIFCPKIYSTGSQNFSTFLLFNTDMQNCLKNTVIR